MQAVHVTAPAAAMAALDGGPGVLISAVGIDAQTRFARVRRAAEAHADAAGLTILRPGLVLGDTACGGSSLIRALAAFPFVTPLIAGGGQVFNPLHACDLARVVVDCLAAPPGARVMELGGPERLTQAEMLARYRAWLGLPPARAPRVPQAGARLVARLGEALRLGPVSHAALTQLEHGVTADTGTLPAPIAAHLRPFSAFLDARPAGTQDLWHARLYLLRPLLRLTLAAMWLVSGLIGLALPAQAFLPLMPGAPLPDPLLSALARLGGVADLALALALLRNWRPRLTAGLQATLVATNTLAFSAMALARRLLPLGGLLENLPVLALIAVTAIVEDER